jgi:hypothetical protein
MTTTHTAVFSARSRLAGTGASATRATSAEATLVPAPVAPATSSLMSGLLMATGIGWNAGLEAQPFHQVMVGVTALVIHVVPLVAVMIVFVRAWRGASRGLGATIAAVLALAFAVFSALFSVTHPHAQMGVHDVNDVLPIAILVAGALVWLVRGRKTHRADRPGA